MQRTNGGERKIVLFDIDGTLVDCGGAGRQAMERAFVEVTGSTDALDGVAFGGMTDPLILDAGLARTTSTTPRERLHALLIEAYLRALVPSLEASRGFRVLPRAMDLVAHATARGHAVGLGTGNVRRGAALKLEKARVWSAFGFGGFACDSGDRAELLRIGAARGAALLDDAGARDDRPAVVWIVGDTPRDVSAAHAIGARCLAVATGRYSREELCATGAEIVVDDLGDPVAWAALD